MTDVRTLTDLDQDDADPRHAALQRAVEDAFASAWPDLWATEELPDPDWRGGISLAMVAIGAALVGFWAVVSFLLAELV